MNKSEFKDLLAYLSSHPSDCLKLHEVFTQQIHYVESEIGHPKITVYNELQREPSCMIKASDAGELIHKSGKWVRQRIREGCFPSAKMVGNTWYLNQGEVVQRYNQYIQNV